ESLPEEKMKRLMLLTTRSPEKPLQLAEFDKQVALEALCQGQTVIPFWCDRIHQKLRDNLKRFSS
ncbi:MAG: MerR family transcriptional regulator, partial [Nostoc sp.]